MNEPQVWTLIGVFATALFGMLTFMSTSLVRLINAKFETIQAQFATVQAQFETVHAKLDHLDRDIQAVARRVFPEHD